jgi:transposase
MSLKEVTEIRPYSTKELATFYGVHPKTLIKWMKAFKDDIGDKRGHYYSVSQVEMIFNKLGMPYKIKGEE